MRQSVSLHATRQLLSAALAPLPRMVDINLNAVNVTDVKTKFVDVVNKVITTKTPAPVRPGKKGDDEEEEDEDEDDDGRPNTKRPVSTPAPTPTYVYTFTMTPPPRSASAVTPSPAPLIYIITGSPLPSPSPVPTTQRPNTTTLSTTSSPPASTAITKTGAKAKSGSGIAVVISVAVVFCLAVVAIAVFVVRRRQSKQEARGKSLSSTHSGQGRTASSSRFVGTANATMDDVTTNYSHMTTTNGALFRDKRLQTSSSMADHPEITAVRIPLEKIEFHDLLSRGGFGEVHRGLYKGQQVAIKRLLPERRKDLRQIDAFLAEAKMMGTLEHERIVHFVGVAWDSLSELCVVSEYMEGGDLRSVLSRWETDPHREQGFDHDKIKIALHVAHAMTYLHSMQPVILHRDLKSKNILLTHDLDAKLTDFGVSRERSDATMTAGVGSSLWMAPEVMMGERYDDKADVFSFGVVLSELDTHRLPYAHASEPGTGRKIPDTAILQMVALGKMEVLFTPNADPDMVALGRDCVALDPKKRPTAGEALHRVHKLWRSCAVTL